MIIIIFWPPDCVVLCCGWHWDERAANVWFTWVCFIGSQFCVLSASCASKLATFFIGQKSTHNQVGEFTWAFVCLFCLQHNTTQHNWTQLNPIEVNSTAATQLGGRRNGPHLFFISWLRLHLFQFGLLCLCGVVFRPINVRTGATRELTTRIWYAFHMSP